MRTEPEFDGPIPGENYTSDTKNYPWHRPPEITDYDEALEFTAKEFKNPNALIGLETMLANGVTVATMTDFFLTRNVGLGKWSIDFALVLAGPVAKTIELIAVQAGYDYEMGIDEQITVPTKEMVEDLAQLLDGDQEPEEGLEDTPDMPMPEDEAEGGGLMSAMSGLGGGPADKETQDEMLGYSDEEEPEVV
tara:strand:+ start:2259 stop:2834 length:576 start_codon:yes stop_codon:yes gene_type:complete